MHQIEESISSDQAAIKDLIARWSKAVRDQNLQGIRADHDAAILMFDVPAPLFVRGLDAYLCTWDQFFAWSDKPIAFDFHDVKVTTGNDVAFATAIGRCAGTAKNGKHEKLEFRLTMGLKKINGSWRILHEHHSVTAD